MTNATHATESWNSKTSLLSRQSMRNAQRQDFRQQLEMKIPLQRYLTIVCRLILGWWKIVKITDSASSVTIG